MYEPMIYIMYSKKCDFACSVVGGSTCVTHTNCIHFGPVLLGSKRCVFLPVLIHFAQYRAAYLLINNIRCHGNEIPRISNSSEK